jgi:predicted glutamine amidotransferase
MCKYFGIYMKKGKANDILKEFVNKGATYSNFGCGIMVYANNELIIRKQTEPLYKFEWERLPEFKMGVFHVRLPSVGKVELKNTHPFISCDGTFAIMHNGTFLYHKLFKKLLLKIARRKHKFIGDTDTEVIMHLIEEGGFKILRDLEQRVVILTNDGRIIGYGGYIVKVKDGFYITNDDDNFFNLFEGRRKLLIDVEKALWEIRNKKLIIKGKAKSEMHLFQKSYIEDLRNYYYWYKGNESWSKGGGNYGINSY